MCLRMDNITLIGAGIGLVGLIIAFVLYGRVKKVEIDDKRVAEITDEIQAGAMAFLFAEYKVLAIFVAVVGAALFFINDSYTSMHSSQVRLHQC